MPGPIPRVQAARGWVCQDGGQDVSQRILSNTFGTAPRSGHALAPPAGWRDIAPRCRQLWNRQSHCCTAPSGTSLGRGDSTRLVEKQQPHVAAGVALGGRWSRFLGPSTQLSERPVSSVQPVTSLTTCWCYRNLVLLSIYRHPMYMILGKESDDVSRFVGVRSAEGGSPAGLGAVEHQLRELGRRREAVFALQLCAPPRQSHPERGHGMQ